MSKNFKELVLSSFFCSMFNATEAKNGPFYYSINEYKDRRNREKERSDLEQQRRQISCFSLRWCVCVTPIVFPLSRTVHCCPLFSVYLLIECLLIRDILILSKSSMQPKRFSTYILRPRIFERLALKLNTN